MIRLLVLILAYYFVMPQPGHLLFYGEIVDSTFASKGTSSVTHISFAESYGYTAFGQMTIYDAVGADITAFGSGVGNPYGFTGRRWDGGIGLWHYRVRAYSSA